MDIGETLDVSTRAAWRRWLEAHHAKAPEIWLVLHTKASGQPSLAYNDAVEEALCFGWIDSIVKKHGPTTRAQRFTPRRAGSPVSEMNKERIRRLAAEGLMAPLGLASAGAVIDEAFTVPPDILAALQKDDETWRNFEAFPDGYRRIRVGWIDLARRRPDVFEQRLAYFLKMTKANKRFGMVQ